MRYRYRVWGFGEGIAMHGLLHAGAEPRAFAAELLRGWTQAGLPLSRDLAAHLAPGVPLLTWYGLSGDGRALDRAREIAEMLSATKLGRHGARLHRPDLAGWENEVWVDCMHLDGPFLVALGRVLHDAHWIDLGVELLLSHARVLQDERTGLFWHGFDDATGVPNGVLWGRGQGWALLGLVDTLRELDPAHPGKDEVHQRLAKLVSGLAATEASLVGRWHTVVDRPETYLEPSVSAFVALGVGEATRQRLMDRSAAPLAGRAWQATLAGIDRHGELVGVSDATPVGADASHYESRATGVFPWGQGPALLAATQVFAEERST